MKNKTNKIVNVVILAAIAVLLFGPDGTVGRRISTAYNRWQDGQRVAAVWDELVGAPSVLGSLGADPGGVIVEFADYDCPACRLVAPTIAERAHQGDATVVVRHIASQPVGSPGPEAARAAICAERQGRFAAAHEALMTDDEWLETRDWAGLAISIGVADMTAFNACLNDESIEQHLARNQALADTLRIPGTPTYVTTQGIHIGAGGFQVAMTAVAGLRDTDVQEDASARRLDEEPLFDSSRELRPEAMALVAANAGLFLSGDRFVIVGRTDFLFVDPASGDVHIAGGKGSGPGEFNFITGTMRTHKGLAAWDLLSRRISFFSADGDFLRSRTYSPFAFQSLMATPVAIHPEGDILFRDGDGHVREATGRTWNPARYVALREDGRLRTIAMAKGNELFYRNDDGRTISEHVIFGHQTFEAVAGDLLAVAQSDTSAITILDWSGHVGSSIPMPAGTKVSPRQIRMARESAAANQDRRTALASRLLGGQQMGGSHPLPRLAMPDLPVNEMTPAIDKLFVDFDKRLWFREYRLPGQDSVTWQVWDIEHSRQLFTLRVADGPRLLDARGDMVMLCEEGALGVLRVVVKLMST